MPLGLHFRAQSEVVIHHAKPTPRYINAPSYPVRSLYFEKYNDGSPLTFEAEFTLKVRPQLYRVDSSIVRKSSQKNCPEFEYFTREQPPHITFSEEIRNLVQEIAIQEDNPWLKARAAYDWISKNMRYSYAREYSTLSNISDYTLRNRYGDCGQIALLFITLCRYMQIPARWQSGWNLFPMRTNIHDWAEIFIDPYGWIPVDANYGNNFEQEAHELADPQRAAIKDFYFGGLDAFRLVVNRDHCYPHFPPKKSFRSDTVDFQRGELEAAGKNLYFDQFTYDMQVKHLWRGEGETTQASLRPPPGEPR